jgi:hypothetical protein
MAQKEVFTVVENAGYEGENDRKSFPSAEKAWNWARRSYRDELETLHVQVRLDRGDYRTYEY